MEIKKVLRQKAMEAAAKAYSPYSKAKVGSAIEMSDGSTTLDATLKTQVTVEQSALNAWPS